MTALDKTLGRFGAAVLRVSSLIKILKVKPKKVAMAKAIEFYIPKDFRKPIKWTPEIPAGKNS